MRKIKWNDYQEKRANFTVVRAELGTERKASSRLRDAKERELLLQLDQSRLESWKREGKYQVRGPRKVKFEI